MALAEKQVQQLKDELQSCTRPIYFFHDDPDGLCSFLLFYRYIKEGKGVVIKTTPKITEQFARKVEEYGADKVFILDIAMVDQEFIDAVKVPIVWVDHHMPLKRHNVKYFNPRLHGEAVPASYVCYQAVEQDLWIAAIGVVSDWFLPDFLPEFMEKYPKLIDREIKEPPEAIFSTRLGEIIKLFSLLLKGPTSDVMKCIKILTRVQSPYELLEHDKPATNFLYKRFDRVNKVYTKLLDDGVKAASDDKILLYIYHESNMAMTKELSNELLYRFPDKIIIAGRERNGEVKLSLRGKDIEVLKVLEKALLGIDGYGGGHEYACGAVIKSHDFDRFLENFRKYV